MNFSEERPGAVCGLAEQRALLEPRGEALLQRQGPRGLVPPASTKQCLNEHFPGFGASLTGKRLRKQTKLLAGQRAARKKEFISLVARRGG